MTLRVLITAAAMGIGRAMAEAFMARGDRVHICDISAENLDKARAELPGLGTTLADVSDPDQVNLLFTQAQTTLGGLDVLINNAGIAGPTGPIEELDLQGWRATLAVILDGTFLCSQHAVPLLKTAGGGCIINISSTAGLHGYPLRSPYATAKWGLIGLTKTLAMELGTFGIRVNAICPGAVSGARMDNVIAAEAASRGLSESEVRARYTRYISLRTFVDAEDIASMALFLCSPAGAKISGQALSVDGHTETLSK